MTKDKNNKDNKKNKKNILLKLIILLIIFFIGLAFTYILKNKTYQNQKSQVSKQSKNNSIEQADKEKTNISVFFNNTKFNPQSINCKKVFAVKRTVKKQENMPLIALQELFKGPTKKEQSKGYNSIFSKDTSDILISLNIKNSTAYINLKDIRNIIPNASSSCGSAHFFASVDSTLRQFGIKKTIFAIKGDPKLFYEWMQIGCVKKNNFCDPSFFKTKSNNQNQSKNQNNHKLRVCPDAWYKNEMPTIEGSKKIKEYFVINNERKEIKNYDLEWIKLNCDVNKPTIVH
jgi:spore germination protein GerM